MGLALRTKLAAHLKLYHLDSKNYWCMDCDSAFNTANDLMCHCSNQHSVKKLKYKSCEYRAVTKVRMKLHIRKHTSGLQCDKCGKWYPNQQSLSLHLGLHKSRREFFCSVCKAVFSTGSSLQIHEKGKHGSGFLCWCGRQFDSPAQCIQHSQKCVN